jgi:hypothetical protein
MRKLINTLASGAALLMAASCNLDLVPEGTLSYDPEQIITNAVDLQGFEAGVMSSMRSLEYGVYDMVSDVMVDYFNALSDFGNNYGPVHRTDDTFTTGDYEIEDNWAGPYNAILHFNIFINGAQKVPAELAADAAVARGEAYFGRAFAYMHLTRHFGKAYNTSTADTDLSVPLVTKYEQTARPKRATVQAVYDQIKSDLDSAAVLLANVPGAVRAQKPTIDAVKAMYARYYLDVKEYAKAAEYAAGLVDSDVYQLSETDAQMNEEWVHDNGTEPILQYFATLGTEGGYGSHAIYTYMGLDNDSHDGLYFDPYFIPSKKLVDAYDDTDLRKNNWFADSLAVKVQGDFVDNIVVFTKYIGNPAFSTSFASTGVYPGTNARKPLMIGEMYLIAAEAYQAIGISALAGKYLNALQAKRGAATTAVSEKIIQDEWYKETVGEGLRFSCLKRWGIGFEGRPCQDAAKDIVASGSAYAQKVMKADDYHFQWPVPTYEMQTNLNLVQNEGYESLGK